MESYLRPVMPRSARANERQSGRAAASEPDRVCPVSWFRRHKRPANQDELERISKEITAAKAQREEGTADVRHLMDAVSQALSRADPVGINFESDPDEYDAEAQTLVIAFGPR